MSASGASNDCYTSTEYADMTQPRLAATLSQVRVPLGGRKQAAGSTVWVGPPSDEP